MNYLLQYNSLLYWKIQLASPDRIIVKWITWEYNGVWFVLTNLTALSMSASANIISGDFPPSSNDTFFTLLAELHKVGGATKINSQSHQVNWSHTSSWWSFPLQLSRWSPSCVPEDARRAPVQPLHQDPTQYWSPPWGSLHEQTTLQTSEQSTEWPEEYNLQFFFCVIWQVQTLAGFSITVFPAARQAPIFHANIISG